MGLFGVVRQASAQPCFVGRGKLTASPPGLTSERRGFGCQRFSGSELGARALHLPAWKKGRGCGVDARVKLHGQRQAVIQRSFASSLSGSTCVVAMAKMVFEQEEPQSIRSNGAASPIHEVSDMSASHRAYACRSENISALQNCFPTEGGGGCIAARLCRQRKCFPP